VPTERMFAAPAEEGNIILIPGFIDNAKAESVNMILEYADKKGKGLVDKVFVTGCLSERYRPDLKKKFLMWINILERLNYLHY
jgi:ribosomal protein S12 methylthiotransferase